MLQNETYNYDKIYRIQDRKYLNDKIITLNKEQMKKFDEILDITANKQLFLYL